MAFKKIERRQFTREEKQYILNKSHGRCCHCGELIEIGESFTVEHVIPISKGGTNDLSNLTALCWYCNQNKADYHMNPGQYFKYLDTKYLGELADNMSDYISDAGWVTRNNFTPLDYIVVEVTDYDTYGMKGFRRKVNTKQGKGILATAPAHNVKVTRARYYDMDDIYKCTVAYNKKYKVWTTETKDEIKRYLTDIFLEGAFYIVRNMYGELVFAIPVIYVGLKDTDQSRIRALSEEDIAKMTAGKTKEQLDNFKTVYISIGNPICVYCKAKYASLIAEISCAIARGLTIAGFPPVPIAMCYVEGDLVSYSAACLFCNNVLPNDDKFAGRVRSVLGTYDGDGVVNTPSVEDYFDIIQAFYGHLKKLSIA